MSGSQENRSRRGRGLRILEVLIAVALLGAVAGVLATTGRGDAGLTAASTSPTASPPPFTGTASRLTEQEQRWMTGITWKNGCPTPLAALRLLHVGYVDFDGNFVEGRVVVNRRVDDDMIKVFRKLYEARFPIEHLDTVELYPPDLRPDKLRNVTAAFNCRFIAGSTSWSQHAYGLAIDINPVQNPWVKGDKVKPRAGRAYVDRTQRLPGMIRRSGPVVDAFRAIGWGWGGSWRTLKDYMHFSRNGH